MGKDRKIRKRERRKDDVRAVLECFTPKTRFRIKVFKENPEWSSVISLFEVMSHRTSAAALVTLHVPQPCMPLLYSGAHSEKGVNYSPTHICLRCSGRWKSRILAHTVCVYLLSWAEWEVLAWHLLTDCA